MKYQSLTIENFRGIMKLDINDLKRVNLFVGRNNCGKTTVLEAFFLLSGMSNPQLSVNIHNFRDLMLASDEGFIYMFKDLNVEYPIVFKGQLDYGKRELMMTPLYDDRPAHDHQKESLYQQEHYAASTNVVRLIEGIKLDCRNHKNKSFHGQMSLKENKLSMPESYKEDLRCAYLNPKTIMAQIDKRMEGLLVQKRLDVVISVLQEIEPKIADVRMGAGGMIYVDAGAEKLMPVNVMGDGMRRILAFLAALADMKNGVLLIDEIENGLHYSSIKIAWKAMVAACKEYNVQLIATTHSYECIEALSTAYAESEPEGDDIRLYRLDKNGERHQAFSMSAQVLKTGLEKEFEVR